MRGAQNVTLLSCSLPIKGSALPVQVALTFTWNL